MTLLVQFQTFFAMMAAGSAIAIQLDVYQRCLPHRARSKWPQAFLDLCFWIVQALIVFYVLFHMNSGELRIYIFLALVLGFVVYWRTVRPFFLTVLEGMIRIVDWVVYVIKRTLYLLLWTPVVWLYKGILSFLKFLLTIVQSVMVQLSKIMLFFIRPIYEAVHGPQVVNKVQKFSKRIYHWFSSKGDDEDK